MIFDEKYSLYYKTVNKIINSLAQSKQLPRNTIESIIEDCGIEEYWRITDPMADKLAWNLVEKSSKVYTPIIDNEINMPLTTLEKRWLKAISLDPRIKLFGVEFDGLDYIEPLFLPSDYCVFDKRNNNYRYEDSEYIDKFQFLLNAIRNKRVIHIQYTKRNGKLGEAYCIPTDLEYSEKDDVFRLRVSGRRNINIVNVERIVSYEFFEGEYHYSDSEVDNSRKEIVLLVTDERNTLERCMLHFAYFHTAIEPVPNTNKYKVYIQYDNEDVNELVIRVLMFGPFVEVLLPSDFRQKIVDKLEQQYNITYKNQNN